MASTQSTSFERSLEQFRRELSDAEMKEIGGANQKSLEATIQKIQNKLGREHSLCKLTRVEALVRAMNNIEELVKIFLNVSEVVAFIWGPIKLALMVATTWGDSVRQLIDVYEETAEAFGNLVFFRKLLQSREHLRLVLEDYFSDILRFHRCVLDVFSPPDGKRLFKWAWVTFRRRVKPIVASLRRRHDMLSDDKLQSHAILKEVEDFESSAKDQFKNLQASLEDIRASLASDELRSKTSQDQEMRADLQRKLDVPQSRADLQLESPEYILESSGNWIFSHPDYSFWETNSMSEGSVLFLNGSPGSGKSTLARTIIRRLREKRVSDLLAYFFFKHDDAGRRSMESMLRHIMMQLVNSDETIMRLAHDECSAADSVELSTLKTMAKDSITSQRSAILVIDGLDEASDNEPEKSLKWCLDELLATAISRGCHLKILISGQRDGRLEPLLSSHPQIRLDGADAHMDDIKEYCKNQAATIRARFSLTSQEEEGLIAKVAEVSQGMFLYARVVLENLASMDSIQEYEDELEAETFPQDLKHAFERVVHRVMKTNGPSRERTVKKILGWVVCSARPLRWREVQSRFCINAEKGTCNVRNIRRDGCKTICSSLVDITDCELFGTLESEQTVHMVHKTAIEYLIHTGTIDLLQEHVSMALFCCRYLSSQPFLVGLDYPDMHTAIQTGYFGFMDYAAVHFNSHCQAIKSSHEKLPSGSESKIAVEAAIRDLARSHCGEINDALVESPPTDYRLETGSQGLGLSIQQSVTIIREAMLARQCDLSPDAQFSSLEGPIRLKCSRIQCSKFAIGFVEQDAYDQHLEAHERPFRCNNPSCFAYVTGYASQQQLRDHFEDVHSEGSQPKFSFPTVNTKSKWDVIEACKAGNLDEVKRFHQAGVNLSVHKRSSPLSLATRAGHFQVCEYLVNNGVDPWSQSFGSRVEDSPIRVAIAHKRVQITELFLFRNHDAMDLPSLIALAISADFPRGLDLLMALMQPEERSEIIFNVFRKLSAFNYYGHSWTIGQEQQEYSFDVTAIHAWLERVIPKLYHDNNALSHVCGTNLRHNSTEYQTVKEAILKNEGLRKQILEGVCYPLKTFMIDFVNKDDLQVKDESGNTPLHLFLGGIKSDLDRRDFGYQRQNYVPLVQRIIQIDDGSSANILNNDGKPPAFLAMNPHVAPETLEALLPFTKDLNHKDNNGQSLLHYPVSSLDHLRVLLKHDRIDLFIRNSKGQTAFSAKTGSHDLDTMDILECLVQADKRLAWTADENRDGRTPLHYAMERLECEPTYVWFIETVEFLLQLPEVEKILQAYLACPSSNNPQKVRQFAKDWGLDEALEIMDRIGF
ncbi:hypothetical protein KAF25_005012 [Fusarium avenaceum]|uniref:NACHT domain-containing protein n=1 Tax=Fusarium avenaceum TaxID=40199 RepID=A0A9P7KUV7_9HYPO|nr:hypothetical protein KAF25_005012 [Fusarium avenaceum]